MPRGQKPLTEAEIELVKRWIAEGAADDTAQNTRARYDMDHPPVYTRPAGDHGARLFTRRHAAGRRRVPRGAPDQRRRLRAARPPGRPGRADRVGPVLARRHPPGRHRRPARADGRGPGLGRRQAQAPALGPRHLRHDLRRELVARRHQDRFRVRRQQRPGHRRQDGRAGPLPGVAQRLGARHRLLDRRLAPGLRRPRPDAPS